MKLKRTLALLTASLILYVSSFLAFRAFPYSFDLVPSDQPGHYLVLFSPRSTNLHTAGLILYAPLIAMFPGNRYCPTRAEHKRLMDVRAEEEQWSSHGMPLDELDE